MNIPYGMKTGKGRPRPSQRERREATTAALLEAAARVFARRGYHGAGVEEIASEAGVTKGALYYNFEGKEDLFLALLDRHVEARIELLRDLGAHGPGTLREGARRVAESLRTDRQWSLLFLEFWAQAARDPRTRRRFAARMRPVHAALAELVAATAPAGVDPERLAPAVEALVDGFALRALARPSDDPAGSLGDALEMLWRGAA